MQGFLSFSRSNGEPSQRPPLLHCSVVSARVHDPFRIGFALLRTGFEVYRVIKEVNNVINMNMFKNLQIIACKAMIKLLKLKYNVWIWQNIDFIKISFELKIINVEVIIIVIIVIKWIIYLK